LAVLAVRPAWGLALPQAGVPSATVVMKAAVMLRASGRDGIVTPKNIEPGSRENQSQPAESMVREDELGVQEVNASMVTGAY
jgi:hypothetical protein